MEIRAPLVLSLILIAGMLAISAWALPLIPETARIAVHFDASGHPNGYMSRVTALFVLPITAILVTVAFAVAARLPRWRSGLAASSSGYVTGWLGSLVILFVAHTGITLLARGWPIDGPGSTNFVLALVLLAVGNGLGKTRPNPLVGVRTWWTKRSDLSWDKTNRLAGRLLIAIGLAVLAALACSGTRTAHIVMIAGIAVVTGVCVALSYVYWRRDPNRLG
jgi:uncharacterized membrane protein